MSTINLSQPQNQDKKWSHTQVLLSSAVQCWAESAVTVLNSVKCNVTLNTELKWPGQLMERNQFLGTGNTQYWLSGGINSVYCSLSSCCPCRHVWKSYSPVSLLHSVLPQRQENGMRCRTSGRQRWAAVLHWGSAGRFLHYRVESCTAAWRQQDFTLRTGGGLSLLLVSKATTVYLNPAEGTLTAGPPPPHPPPHLTPCQAIQRNSLFLSPEQMCTFTLESLTCLHCEIFLY